MRGQTGSVSDYKMPSIPLITILDDDVLPKSPDLQSLNDNVSPVIVRLVANIRMPPPSAKTRPPIPRMLAPLLQAIITVACAFIRIRKS